MYNSLNSLNTYGCVGMLLLSGATKEALMSELSDMDYLRSKVAKADTAEERKDKKDDEEVEDDDADEDSGSVQHPDSAYESGENAAKTKPSASSKNKMQSKDKKNAQQEVTVEEEPWCCTFLYVVVFALFHRVLVFWQMEPTTPFTVKLRGAPFNVKEVSNFQMCTEDIPPH